jgi:CCR4-NOT transcription complex subunit 9
MSNNLQNRTIKKNDNKIKDKKELNEEEMIIKWINEIKNENTRIKAIINLSKYSDNNNELALYLWYSRGTMAVILQEIISVYQYLSTSKLTLEKANVIYCAISLLKCIASNPETRHEFLESKILIFLYPFINNTNKAKPYEYLKLSSLSVINALLTETDNEIISFLIDTEIIPKLLKIMEKGAELTRKIACCIVSQIVQDDNGSKYISEAKERYSAIITYMKKMLKINCNQVTINRILKAFLKLSENKDAKNILKNDILKEITDKNFINFLCDSSKNILNNLLIILNENNETNKIKELKKELSVNNNIQNINIVKNITINNNININQQLNMNNGDLLNQKNSNINTNILLVNQINQMKIQQGYMVSPNYTDINFNIYNNNDNYMNNMNYMNNFNSNKGFGNIYYYNYKNS